MKKEIIRSNGTKYSIKDNKHRFLYPHEYNKLYENLKQRQKHTATVLINTGARINEARNIKVSDCDLERKRIVLRVTKSKAKKGESKVGGGRIRVIPISKKFAKYLKKYFKDNNLDSYSFIKILSTSPFDLALKKAAKKANIKDSYNISAHNLRKTLETWLMALNVDGLKLVAHFGHTMQTAASNYVSPDIFTWEERQEIMRLLDDLYAPSIRGHRL